MANPGGGGGEGGGIIGESTPIVFVKQHEAVLPEYKRPEIDRIYRLYSTDESQVTLSDVLFIFECQLQIAPQVF